MKKTLRFNGINIALSIFIFVQLFFNIKSHADPAYYNYNNGTSSNSFPFNVTGGKAVNYLFLPGDFNVPVGKQITTIYFRTSTAYTATYTNLHILLSQDTITNLPTASFYAGPYDTVFSRASVSLTSTANGWMSIVLDKPFYYDTTKSLILFVGQCGTSGTGSNVYNSTTSGVKRTYSVGGCPFVISGNGTATLNFGIDVTSALNGTYNIPGGCFKTIASAVSALNAYGVAGAVTFNIAPGYTETAPAGGYILGSDVLNATTSSTNKILFQKNGAGTNPLITAPVGTSTALDGIWIIQGTDYVTINGIDIQESAANTTATTQMEWGYALLKLNVTDGCQYDTIKNCTVTLNKANTASRGIYINNHTTASTTALTLTAVTGANSYNRIFSNTITNCYSAIYAYGSSDANYYDLNNYIGYGSTTGNTITNFGGSSVATYGIYAAYQNNLYVYYNNVNGAAGNTTTAYGIYAGTGLNSTAYIRYNIVTITPSSAGYGIYNNLGGTGTSNTVYINNNTVQNCTTTSTFGGIANNASCYNINIYSNTIINNTIATTNESYGIYTPGDVVNILAIYSNSIYNNSNTSAGTLYGICNYPAAATTSNIYTNTIYAISSAAKVYGIFCRYSTTANIYRNNVYNLSTSGTGSYIYGHYYMGVTTLNTYNNFISDINTPSANLDLAIAGIAINSDVTTANLFYNTIFLNETSTSALFGSTCLNANTAPTVLLRNNIFVNTSTPNGTGVTAAYRRSSTTLTSYSSTSDNNCFYAGTPGTSNLLFYDGTNAIQTIDAYRTFVSTRDASSFTELPPFINRTTAPYNLHLNTTDTTQCEKGGIPISSPISITNDFDNGSRNTVNPDVGADEFSGVPDYPNIAYANLPNTSSTSNITTSGWATIRDISGINTTTGTAPRLYYKKSAHNNTYVDNTSSTNGWKWVESSNTSSPFDFTIDYSKLYGGTVSFGDKIMYFIVAQDILGVPKLSIKSGTFTTAPASVNLTSAAFPVTGTVNSYMITNSTPLSGDYTISLSLFNRITGKNLVAKEFTRKVMRDIEIDNIEMKDKKKSSNTNEERILTGFKTEVEEKYYALSENGILYTGPTYVAFTPEIRKQFDLSDNFIGNYANISSAAGDLNSAGISASVTFSLLDANYGDSGTPEDFPITIGSVAGAGPGATITIKPSTVTPVISGASSTSIIKLDQADYVILNGSNSNGTDRSLTIENTKSSTGTTAIWLASGSVENSGAANNIIKNCNIKTGTNSPTTYGIFIGGTTIGTPGYDNDNNTIQNNYIYKAYYGIYTTNNSTTPAENLNLTGNTLGAPVGTATDYLGYSGIYQNYTTGSVVTQNTVQNMISTVTGKRGIFLSTGVTNAVVSGNKINTIRYTGTGGYGARGIDLNTGNSSSNIKIFNNIIYDILGDGDPSSFTYMPMGIGVDGSTGGVGIYNNSIYLYGDAYNGGSTYAGLFACIFVNSTALTLDIRNNILVNTIYKTSNSGAKAYSFYTSGSGASFTNINCNDYYVSGANGVLCFLSTDITALSGWKTATGQDQFSLNADPGFTSSTDLSINTSISNCWNVNGGGYPVSTVTTDFEGNPRSSSINTGACDIGAYEFTPSVSSPNLTVTGPITDGGTSTLTYAGITLAAITWHSGTGTLPSAITAIFYPQVNPPNPTGNYANENFVVNVTGGSGYTYDIIYYYNLARQNTISGESEIRLAKYDASIGWEQFESVPNTTTKSVSVSGISTFSTFTFGDNSSPLPVKLKSFVSNISGRDVKLTWITESEKNNKGFEILRSLNSENNYRSIAFINGKGNSNIPSEYIFTDFKLNSGKYEYKIKQIDFNGNYNYFKLNNPVEVGIPVRFNMSQNYPNPFNPVTKIDFDLPSDSRVSLKIYDMTGREMKSLLTGELKSAGYHTIEFNSANLSSGVYFYRMIVSSLNKDIIFTKKMVILK